MGRGSSAVRLRPAAFGASAECPDCFHGFPDSVPNREDIGATRMEEKGTVPRLGQKIPTEEEPVLRGPHRSLRFHY